MADKTILCNTTKTTVFKYREMINQRNRKAVVTFIRQRFAERYLAPIEAIPNKPKDLRNGFCTMAICCLMIETLASFWKGRKETPRGEGANTFIWFFAQSQNVSLADLKGYGAQFYTNVRCGILHQGETKNGWIIRRDGRLFDPNTLTVNATKFHRALSKCLDAYCKELETSAWDGPTWLAFRLKMDTICQNC